VVDLAWEVLRLRRLKANLMACAAHRGVATLLRPLIEEDEERALRRCRLLSIGRWRVAKYISCLATSIDTRTACQTSRCDRYSCSR
jgi:hypothetical protein